MKKSIRTAYLEQDHELIPFYKYPPQAEYIDLVIQDKSKENVNREVLVEELIHQNSGLKLSQKTQNHLELLRQSNTFTITTGQQIGIYGGPLYTVYKTISAIKLAQNLSQHFPEYNFVPVFWMATEDHDAEEVNHLFLEYGQKLTYNGQFTGAVGRHTITKEIHSFLSEEAFAKVKHFYQEGLNWTKAFRTFWHDLFDSYGLILLDGDCVSLKEELKPVIVEELKHRSSAGLIETTDLELTQEGFPTQAKAREINFFYLTDSLRERILEIEGGFKLAESGKEFTTTELLSEVELHPERFSPNVILRPVYQEKVLPNVVYVGGWGEISYWMQLKRVFEHFDVNYPMLIPRMSACLIDHSDAEAWNQLGFHLKDIELPLHQLMNEYISRNWDLRQVSEKMNDIVRAFDLLAAELEPLDPTLAISMKGAGAREQKNLDKFLKKVFKSIRNQKPKPFSQIETLKNKVQPDGWVQERTLNILSVESWDHKQVMDDLMMACNPFNFDKKWMVLK